MSTAGHKRNNYERSTNPTYNIIYGIQMKRGRMRRVPNMTLEYQKWREAWEDSEMLEYL
jgi:hypothetical protein